MGSSKLYFVKFYHLKIQNLTLRLNFFFHHKCVSVPNITHQFRKKMRIEKNLIGRSLIDTIKHF